MANTNSLLPGVARYALPPVLARELRAGGRRSLFFWMRGLLALALGFQAYELLDRYGIASPMRILPGAAALQQMAWLLFLAILIMGLVSADSINRERREGTLGLLLLTDLTPGEIVRGKMLSCGLTSFAVLLGALPALMIPILAGGVTGAQAAITGMGLLNTLFVVLAAGLWMSALFRERRSVVLATLGSVAGLAFGPEILGGTYFGRGAMPFFRLFGLAGWATAASAPRLGVPIFFGWLLLTQALGWLLLWRAAATLAATWQDRPHKQFREPDPDEVWLADAAADAQSSVIAEAAEPDRGNAGVPLRTSWLTDPRPWEADPVRWRVERLGSAEGLIWLAVAISFFAQFGTLGATFSGAARPDLWGLLSFAGTVVIAFSGGLVAWAGARFFQDSQRQQDLELLLTTPLGASNILSGQWRVLRRALKWPVGLLLALALPAGISLLYDFLNGSGDEPWLLLQPFLIAVNLALEVVALCWAGMWFGLRGRNRITSVTAAVGLVQLLPLALAVGLMWIWPLLPIQTLFRPLSRSSMPPVVAALLFFVVKNLGLIVWTRRRLRKELRLGKRAGFPSRVSACLPRRERMKSTT